MRRILLLTSMTCIIACGRSALDVPDAVDAPDAAIIGTTCKPGDPVRVIASRPKVTFQSIVVDDARVYYTDDIGAVWSVGKDGFGTHELVAPDAQVVDQSPLDQTADDLVVWLTAISKTTGTEHPFLDGPYGPSLATWSFVYVIDASVAPPNVARVPANGGALEPIATFDKNVWVAALTASDSYVYGYATNVISPALPTPNLMRVSIEDQSVKTFEVEDLRSAQMIRGVGGFYAMRPLSATWSLEYWSDADEQFTTMTTPAPLGAAVADAHGLDVVSFDGTFTHYDLDGSSTKLGDSYFEPSAIALDATCFYIATGDTLLRIPRP